MIEQRTFGRTAERVSAIGFGAWGLGGAMWQGGDEGEGERALHRALDLGITFLDTALTYGPDVSERIVGRVVRERSGRAYVATKVPPKNGQWPARPEMAAADVFPREWVVEKAERSLKNLGLERIDLLQLHVWQDSFLADDGWRRGLDDLRAAGKVRHVGVSVGEHDADSALEAARSGAFDAFQVLYNIFDPRAAAALFPACQAAGAAVIARVPFDEGGLSGAITPETTFPAGDFRNAYFEGDRKAQVWRRCEALKMLMGEEARSLPELALRFCLSHDAVATVIPGMRKVVHVERNAAAGDGRRLSPGLLAVLAQHAWPRNFWWPRERAV